MQARSWVTLSLAALCACSSATTRSGYDTEDPEGSGEGTFVDGGGSAPATCVAATLDGQLRPLDLVVMLDKSESMKETVDGTSTPATTKWQAVSEALASFAADPSTKGMNASLAFFDQGTTKTQFCSPSSYLVPRVALTPLPDTTAFTSALATTFPFGPTPTAAALEGAGAQAAALQAAHPDHHVVVVFVTDGLPEGCDDQGDVTFAAKVAKDAFDTHDIPTYVVGIGSLLQNLETIAQAGGTGHAHLVDASSGGTPFVPSFLAELDSVRDQAGACALPMPDPPDGVVFDLHAVNVSEWAGGTETSLSYDRDCANGRGWYYDDAAHPTRIELCPASCADLHDDTSRRVTFAFGCTTRGDVR